MYPSVETYTIHCMSQVGCVTLRDTLLETSSLLLIGIVILIIRKGLTFVINCSELIPLLQNNNRQGLTTDVT